jgi:hypothetical protein
LPRKMYGRNVYRGTSVEVQRSRTYLGNRMWPLDLVSARFLLYLSFCLIICTMYIHDTSLLYTILCIHFCVDC